MFEPHPANPGRRISILCFDTLGPADFAILASAMSSNTPSSQPSGKERREYYRITVALPIRIQPETDTTEGELTEKSVNISGGGIGVAVTESYTAGDVLSLTLLLPDQVIFKSSIEVLRLDPIPYPAGTYRLHARFVRMPSQDRELLIKHIVRLQRDRLQEHYSA